MSPTQYEWERQAEAEYGAYFEALRQARLEGYLSGAAAAFGLIAMGEAIRCNYYHLDSKFRCTPKNRQYVLLRQQSVYDLDVIQAIIAGIEAWRVNHGAG